MSKARPEVAIGAILTDADGRVLLIQRGQQPAAGCWTLPGGRVEFGETLAEALDRELWIETGLRAERGPLAEVFEYIAERYHYVILDYRMTNPVGVLRAGEDAVDARFYSLDEAATLKTTEGLLPILRRVLGS